MEKQIKKYKLELIFFGLFVFIFISALVFAPVSFRKAALALTGYSRTVGVDDNITLNDWNNLDVDFLATDGSNSMAADLNMGGNNIVGIGMQAVPAPNDVATVNYVNSQIASMSGGAGDVYVNWGRADCQNDAGAVPAGVQLLYNGYGFSTVYNSVGGSSNPVCIEGGDSGFGFSGVSADEMNPLVTASNSSLPISDSSISQNAIVPCSLCNKNPGTCYEHVGSDVCGTGFSPVYTGYLLGGLTINNRNPTKRECVNKNFDAGKTMGAGDKAMWYGSRIVFDLGAPYTRNTFIKCAICCK